MSALLEAPRLGFTTVEVGLTVRSTVPRPAVLFGNGAFACGCWRFVCSVSAFSSSLGVVLATSVFVVGAGTRRQRVSVDKLITVRNGVRKINVKSGIYAHYGHQTKPHIETRNSE